MKPKMWTATVCYKCIKWGFAWREWGGGGWLNKQDLRRTWNYCLKQLESTRKIWKTTTDTSPQKTQNNTSFTRNVKLPLLQSKTGKKKKKNACSYLFLLLTCQLHLLPLLFHLRGGELLLFIVRGQELLAQADQLGDHGGELVLLFRQALRSTCKERGGGGRKD